MDTYCIERGTLLDNPSVVTLEGPEQHTIHCLVDVPRCYNSGFEILGDPSPPNTLYCRAFKLDATGQTAALTLARSAGSTSLGCSTCTGTAEASARTGFRATITGTFDTEDLNDPKILTTTTIELADNNICPNDDTKMLNECSTKGAGGTSGFVVAHGALMLSSWGVVLPCGVLVAKFLRHQDPLWFKIHRFMQICGVILALIGFCIALTQFSVFSPDYYAPAQIHGICGIIVMVLGLMQPINAYFRPHKDKQAASVSPIRQRWEYLHKGSGWFAIVLAIPTIILGTTLAGGDRTLMFQIVYGVCIVLISVLICYLIQDGRKKKNVEMVVLE